MEYMTVSEVSREFEVSTRMLRYYEKKGLIQSSKKEDYAYRIYDENAVRRLQLIIVMRKLRVPLKQILLMMEQEKSVAALEILKENLNELEEEAAALEVIRNILKSFIEGLSDSIHLTNCLDVLDNQELLTLSRTLCLSKHKLKEEATMKDLNEASEVLENKMDARIVLLPPYTVAAYHFIGENPEEAAGDVMDQFVRESKLYERKPDARMFGFNHPNPSDSREHYGYEIWITIPDDMEIPDKLTKKSFAGGLYAAHAIDFPNFHEWKTLAKWVEENEKYDANYSELGEEIMGGSLEEHLNWVYSSHKRWPENGIDGKLDLLLPIKHKE